MKRPGERIRLTHVGFCSPPLEAGDIVQTSTGRRYEVLEVGDIVCRDGRDPEQKFEAVVLRPGANVGTDARILHWRWLSRGRKRG